MAPSTHSAHGHEAEGKPAALNVAFDPAPFVDSPCHVKVESVSADGSTASDAITIWPQASRDTVPPDIKIHHPANGATVSGVVEIAFQAKDDFGVARSEIRIDGKTIQNPWDTRLYANGPHELSIWSMDTADNQSILRLNVVVQNDPELTVADLKAMLDKLQSQMGGPQNG